MILWASTLGEFISLVRAHRSWAAKMCFIFWPHIHFKTMCQVNRCTISSTPGFFSLLLVLSQMAVWMKNRWHRADERERRKGAQNNGQQSVRFLLFAPFDFGSVSFISPVCFFRSVGFAILRYSSLSQPVTKRWGDEPFYKLERPKSIAFKSHALLHALLFSIQIEFFSLIRYKIFISSCFPSIFVCISGGSFLSLSRCWFLFSYALRYHAFEVMTCGNVSIIFFRHFFFHLILNRRFKHASNSANYFPIKKCKTL